MLRRFETSTSSTPIVFPLQTEELLISARTNGWMLSSSSEIVEMTMQNLSVTYSIPDFFLRACK